MFCIFLYFTQFSSLCCWLVVLPVAVLQPGRHSLPEKKISPVAIFHKNNFKCVQINIKMISIKAVKNNNFLCILHIFLHPPLHIPLPKKIDAVATAFYYNDS